MSEIRAEMAATVWELVAVEGHVFDAGEVLILLESMKMEIPVEAPAPGRVKQILVNVGESVQAGDILLLMDP